MAETLAQLKAKLKRYEVSGIMSKSKIDGVKKQIADKEKQQQKQAKTGVSDAQKQKQLKVPAKPPRSSAINPNSNTSGKTVAQRRKERKNKPFFKGDNITFSQAQRDKLGYFRAGKGSSVIKMILKKIDNAKTLEEENKQRKRFEKLFNVAAPKSTNKYEKVEQTSAKAKLPKLTGSDKKVKKTASVPSVDEMGGKGNNTGVGPDASAPKIEKDPPKKTKTKTKISDSGGREDAKVANKPRKRKPLEQGKRKIKTPFGTLTVDSTDKGMSKFSGFDNREELEAEEEMNFRKGGMARANAFGKGGMYKTPKKAYGMRYGGVTRKLKG